MLHDEASRWVGHIVRKHAASRAPPELKSQLKLGEVFLTIDYKCKPLSRKNREPQSENFGKRGKSLFGLSALFLKETMCSVGAGAASRGACVASGDRRLVFVVFVTVIL